MLTTTLLGLIAINIFTLACFKTAYADEAPKIQVEVSMETVKLTLDREVKLLVVARNPSTATLRNIKLSWLTSATVDVESENSTLDFLKANEEHAWTIRISAKKDEQFIPGTINFLIDYTVETEGQPLSPKRVAVSSLTVENSPVEDVDQIADVKIETTLESLNAQNPGKVYLVITNKTSMTLNVEITPRWPEPIKIEDDQSKIYSTLIAPYQSNTRAIDVKAKERVRSGKYLLFFDVLFKWGAAGNEQSRHKIVTRPVDIGVMGESQLLTLLGVPSFLLLPGFLMLVTYKILWSISTFRVKGQPEKFLLEVKSAEFWLVAITISIIVSGAYSMLWYDLLSGYGLWDIITLWFLSVILLGIGGYLLGIFLYKAYRYWNTPSREDTPIRFLKKLGKLKLKIVCDRGEFKTKVDNQEQLQRFYLLEAYEDAGDKIRVAPAITLKWTDATTPAFKERVREQLEPDGEGDPTQLAQILEEGTNTKGETNLNVRPAQVTVEWESIGTLDRPGEVNKSDFVRYAGPARIVDEDAGDE
jgi:hypothetical protein